VLLLHHYLVTQGAAIGVFEQHTQMHSDSMILGCPRTRQDTRFLKRARWLVACREKMMRRIPPDKNIMFSIACFYDNKHPSIRSCPVSIQAVQAMQ
jgi:hypothetical protein